jgi:phospholipase C
MLPCRAAKTPCWEGVTELTQSALETRDAPKKMVGFGDAGGGDRRTRTQPALPPTRTPIKHVVVLFQENVSFHHYFGTYQHALNLPSEQRFDAAPGTRGVDGVTPRLLEHNPNSANPIRWWRQLGATCDRDHKCADEQAAFNGGKMNRLAEATASPAAAATRQWWWAISTGIRSRPLWNYAQHFAMSDRYFGTTFGPSTPGANNLVSGNTHGAVMVATSTGFSWSVSRDSTSG